MSPITDTMELSAVRVALGNVSDDAVSRLIDAGEFPEPISVTARGRIWFRADVEWFLYGKSVKSRLKEISSAHARTGPHRAASAMVAAE